MHLVSFLLFSFLGLALGQTYCSSGPTTTVDSNLGAVTLNGDGSNIIDDSNCPGYIGPRDLTALKADLSIGKTYTLTFTVTTCGNSFPTLSGAWIDYNNNKLFDDSEKLFTYVTDKNAVVKQFTVPEGGSDVIAAGASRLRVQVQETQATTLNPCATFPYGATKDYSIEIKSPGGAGSGGGLSGGTVFIIIVLVGAVVYVAVGCFYNKFKKGTTGVKESCPQGDFWCDLPSNFIEGFRFTKRKLCGGGGGYDKLGGGTIDQNDL